MAFAICYDRSRRHVRVVPGSFSPASTPGWTRGLVTKPVATHLMRMLGLTEWERRSGVRGFQPSASGPFLVPGGRFEIFPRRSGATPIGTVASPISLAAAHLRPQRQGQIARESVQLALSDGILVNASSLVGVAYLSGDNSRRSEVGRRSGRPLVWPGRGLMLQRRHGSSNPVHLAVHQSKVLLAPTSFSLLASS